MLHPERRQRGQDGDRIPSLRREPVMDLPLIPSVRDLFHHFLCAQLTEAERKHPRRQTRIACQDLAEREVGAKSEVAEDDDRPFPTEDAEGGPNGAEEHTLRSLERKRTRLGGINRIRVRPMHWKPLR